MQPAQQPDEPLDVEEFDAAACRPELLCGLPYNLAALIGVAGIGFVMVWDTGQEINDLIADAVVVIGLGMIGATARIMLARDYHGWHNFLAWLRLDVCCLDTREHGGARLATLPLRSRYRVTEVIRCADTETRDVH